MTEKNPGGAEPPKISFKRGTSEPETSSLADLLEWFLNFDERTARIRHPHSDELFRWKQADDASNGVSTYPFENAEARFAIGAIQAVSQNNSEPLLKLWITDVLDALHESRETKAQLTESYKLDTDPEASALERSEKLTTNTEKRIYLTSCWLEVLCTAEARVLGWVYQELYGKPFSP